MSQKQELTEEQYETLRRVTTHDQQTPEQLLGRMVDAPATTQGAIEFTDDELPRVLGADGEELTELAKLEVANAADE
jgi:hypothetical protein